MMTTVLVGGIAWATEPATPGAQPKRAGAAQGTGEGVMDPKADAALRRMSDYLTSLKTMRVDTTTVDEKVTTNGHKVQQLQDSHVTVERPDALRVDRIGPNGHVTFRYNGKEFWIYNKDRNVYAMAPAPAKLDAAIDDVRDRLHIDVPGGDLLVSDPYKALTEGTIEGRYLGLESVEGTMAHHLAVIKKDTTWQIWIKDGPDAVPLRYVITSEDIPSHPQFTLELRNWQPNAQVAPDSFAFTPPSGAKRVDFAPPKKAER
jgi:hypothetical protein